MAEREAMESHTIELPELVKHHILSFLSIKEATKTSVLSKAWLSAWRMHPTLEFDYNLFFTKELRQERYRQWDQEKKTERCTKFFKYITATLEKYCQQDVSIDTFKLWLEQNYDWYDLVEKCMTIEVKKCVRNLYLSLIGCRLPQSILGTKSLVDLTLRYCRITQESVGEIMCHGLKRLYLSMVSFDEVKFENMIKSCQLIETLEIHYCHGMDNFRVTNLPNLKQFTIFLVMYQTVEVEEPSLELLACTSVDCYSREKEVNCWITLHASNQYQNLKCLLLSAVGINDIFFVSLAYKFPNLQNLFVRYCHYLERIKVSSRSIKKIQMMDNRNLVEAQFDVPNLVLFEYRSWDIIPQLHFVAASIGWVSNINIGWMTDVDTSWFLKLKEFLASLIQSKISLRVDFLCRVAFDLDEIRNCATFHEPQEMQELSVFNDKKRFCLSEAPLALDGIFWVCGPKTIKQHWNSSYPKNEATKFLYEMLMFGRIQDRVHNLQHDLKKVEVEIFNGALGLMGGRIVIIKEGEKEQLQEDLDWENFLNVLENDSYFGRMIYFKLEWRREGKRLEGSISELA